jgi:hypothetical protein
MAPFGRDRSGGCQFSQPVDVVMERGSELFKDYGQVGEVARIHGLSRQCAYAIFEPAGSGKGRNKASKQGPSRWLLMIHEDYSGTESSSRLSGLGGEINRVESVDEAKLAR